MEDLPAITRIAALLADPARARMVWTLIDGTMRPAGELAYAANVSAQSASMHLAKLVDGGLLAAQPQGRHRYFRLASPEVAGVVEDLASVGAAGRAREPRPARPAAAPAQFLIARTCYGHLAGETAVRILQAMLEHRWLVPDGRGYALTTAGERKLGALRIDLATVRQGRRAFARPCVDLTQRRPHLGGALGDALLNAYVARGWVQRQRRSRAVNITPKGSEAFRLAFGI